MAAPLGQAPTTSKPNSSLDPAVAPQPGGLQPTGKEVQDSIHSRPGTLSTCVPRVAGRQSSGGSFNTSEYVSAQRNISL